MKPLIIFSLIIFNSLYVIGQQNIYPDSGFTDRAEAKNQIVNGIKEGKWKEYLTMKDDMSDSAEDDGWEFIPIKDTNSADNYNYQLIVYKKGSPFGISRIYYSSGKLISEIHYSEGKIKGTVVDYYESGATNSLIPYINGEKSGIIKYYYEDGKVWAEAPNQNGHLNGVEKTYYKSGKIQNEIPYSNGKSNGVAKYYYEDGKLSRESSWSDGKFEGDKSYYKNGVLKETNSYGGDVKFYYENGNLKREMFFANGKKGVSKYYYEKGGQIIDDTIKNCYQGKLESEDVIKNGVIQESIAISSHGGMLSKTIYVNGIADTFVQYFADGKEEKSKIKR